jgi:hypothetical protein
MESITTVGRLFVRSIVALALGLALVLPSSTDAAVLDGIDVVDSDQPFISDNIELVTTIPLAGAIGANFRGSYMYVTGVEGLTTFDISDPLNPRLTSVTPLPHFENEDVSIGGNLLLIANDSSESVGILYVFDIGNASAPRLVATMLTGGDILLNDTPSHTVTCINNCQWAYLAGTSRGIVIVDLRVPTTPRIAGEFKPPITGFATHDVQVDSSNLAWIVGGQGTAAYDTTNPIQPKLVAQTDAAATTGPLNDFIHHNSWRPNRPGSNKPGSVVLVTEEDYARPTCEGAGSFQTWKINGTPSATTPAVLTNLDSWATELDELTRLQGKSPATILCSAHYFDEDRGLVAQGWYEQGTRILDVRDPANIKQVGYFVMPVTETWAAYWSPTAANGDIIYTIDLARGIDVLRIERPAADAPAKKAPVRKKWTSDGTSATLPAAQFSTAHSTFEWACRLPKLTP